MSILGTETRLTTSQSSPRLHISDEDFGNAFETQVELNDEERSYLPWYNKTKGIRMKHDFVAEAVAEYVVIGKNYLSSTEREKYQFTFQNGVFKDQNQWLLHGEFLYVLLWNNKLYGCKPTLAKPAGVKPDKKWFHSYLSSGVNVKAAGVIYCHYGKIITISNESGHYKPTREDMLPALHYLQQLSNTPLVFEDHSCLNPELPNQGVQHFEVNIENDELLLTPLDLKSLDNLITKTTEAAVRHYKNNAKTTPLANGKLDPDSYEDSDNEEQTKKAVVQTMSLPENDFMKHTCLWRMNDPNYRSRALGKK